MRRTLWLVCLLAGLALLIAQPALAQDEERAPRTVYLVDLEGMIHGGVTNKLEKSIDQALRGGAEALVIRMDTPGGLLDSTREIVKVLLNAPLPIFVYVAPSGAHAGSAGVMITMAAHVAAMAPGTNIGAATPVSGTGQEIPEDMKRKVTNDTAAFVEAIAQQRKRNTEWAIDAVRDAVSITDREALKLNVVDIVAPTIDDLLAQADGRVVDVQGKDVTLATKDARIVHVELDLKDRLQIGLANPSLAFAFMLVAILGIYVEVSHPGMIVPGAIGALSAILFLFAIQVLPFNMLGLLLILLSFVLFALEMKFTSYGVLTAAGLASFAGGSLLLFDVPDEVFDPASVSFRVPAGLVLPATAALGVFVVLIVFLIVRTHRGRVLSANEGLIGEIGDVRRPPVGNQRGQVFVHGEYWRATSKQPLEVGDRVRVVAYENLTVEVEKVES